MRRSSDLISNSTSVDGSKTFHFKGRFESVSLNESTEVQRKHRSRERILGTSRLPRCKGPFQDAPNSSRFLAAKSRLRAVCEVMMAEKVRFELTARLDPDNPVYRNRSSDSG
jgi:hypothetical protein